MTITVNSTVTRSGVYRQVYASTLAALRTLRGEIAILSGYYAAGDGGGGTFVWSNTTALDDGGVTVNFTAGSTAAGWRRVIEGDQLNILWFGAQEGETADVTKEARNHAAITAALASVAATVSGFAERRAVYVPPGVWWMSAAISIATGLGQRIVGAGRSTTQIKNRYGTTFSFVSTSLTSHFALDNLQVVASAGRAFEAIGAGTLGLFQATFRYVTITGTSTAHELIYIEDRLASSLFDNCIFTHADTSVVPAIYLKSANINDNTWRSCTAVRCGQYFFRIENTSDTTWCINNRFEDIVSSGTMPGLIEGLGVKNLVLDGCNADSGTITGDYISIGPSTNVVPLASQDNIICNSHRRAGTITGHDIALDPTTLHTRIDNCHAQGGTAFKLSLGDTPVTMTGVRSDNITIIGDANLTWLRQGALVVDGKASLLSGEGDPNTVQDGAKGSLYTDRTDAKLYLKTTDAGFLTGWVEMAAV